MLKESKEKLEKSLKKNQNKIFTIEKFREIISTAFPEKLSEGKIYKLTHQLKNRGYLISLKKDIFFIKSPEKEITETELEDQFYRPLLKQHCQQYCKQDRYIGGMTALEIHLHTTGINIPDEIIIFNKEKQAVETVLFDKKINFKIYESKSQNLFPAFSKHTQKHKLKGGIMRYANLELAILECLYNINPSNKGTIEKTILKAVKNFQKTISIPHFQQILKLGKHNSSINRLYTLLSPSYPALAIDIKNLIKKYGHIL
ncbi:MAG: hypothetical protein LBO09_09575 [Candidatus Peribacteria bacterium]|jgi:hypothetical protein|nr:hypothetical protein [Candidatus Peribacteria bacterium]